MVEAKTEILALPQPPLGRAVLAGQVAARMVTAPPGPFGLGLGLDPDALEERRIEIHRRTIGAGPASGKEARPVDANQAGEAPARM